MTNTPTYHIDFYSDEFIKDPHPHYAKMRELGAVVWLPHQRVYALPRYKEVSEVLRQPLLFISSKGVSLYEKTNDIIKGSTLNSDPPMHDRTRAITAAPLLPGALTGVEGRIRDAADGLVDSLCARGSFDAISDFATYLPVTIVAELVGLPDAGRDNMLKWASATFNLFSNPNPRALAAFDDLKDLAEFLQAYGHPDKLKPGGWAARIFRVGEAQGIPFAACAQLMRDYINPSLDTTISATGQTIKLLADNPDQWQRLRQDPALIPNAVDEAVRLSTPIRAFTRYVAKDTQIAGVPIAEGQRVMVIYASANRDERKYKNPDTFDVSRDVHDHVGFGQGVHMCMGMHLARLEMESLLYALVRRVARFELLGEPEVAMNNTIRAYSKMPVKVHLDETLTKSVVMPEKAPVAQWQEVVITERKQQADGIISLTFAATSGAALPKYSAGAHIDVFIREGLVRQYSLCQQPHEKTRYRIGVLHDPDSKGGSSTIHREFTEGKIIRIGKPRNHFPLQKNAAHSILIAGGIGITPMLAIAYELHEKGQSFELHYCAKSRNKLAFADELNRFENVHFYLSDEQRINLNNVLGAPQKAHHIYTCGPNGFMDFVVNHAINLGWKKSQIHLERFGNEVDTDGEQFTVIAQKSGLEVVIPPGKTIAEVLLEHGITIPMSCQSGVCGTCITKVAAGKPDHRDLVLTDAEKAANDRMTVCCSRSKTKRLVLEV